jgi:YVTN family beta-propeller protein
MEKDRYTKHMNKTSLLPLAAVALLAAIPAGAAPVTAPNYHLLQKVTLGGEGGWDYLTVDPDARRLYISRGTHVMVVDADTEKVVGDIPNTNGVHGIAIASKLGRGFTSNGRDNTVTIFDLKTLKTLGTVPVGTGPDCIIYEPKTQRVFTFNGRSNDSTAIDAKTGKVAGTIALGGRPEYAAVDGAGMVYDNLESTSEVVAIDANTLAVKKRWPLAPAESPSGLAIDPKNQFLFSVCDGGKMAVSSTQFSKVLTIAPIGNGPDAAAYDPGTGLVFSSNGQDGTLTVLRQDDLTGGIVFIGKYFPLQTVTTQAGARTMALDTKTHRVFLVTATPDPNNPGAGRRRNYVPGSFTLLVVGP